MLANMSFRNTFLQVYGVEMFLICLSFLELQLECQIGDTALYISKRMRATN